MASNRTKKVIGEEHKCHANTCDLWYANKDNDVDFNIATGYALTDGSWYQHTWGILKKSRSAIVVETTSAERDAYYGYVLNEEEAMGFYHDNF